MSTCQSSQSVSPEKQVPVPGGEDCPGARACTAPHVLASVPASPWEAAVSAVTGVLLGGTPRSSAVHAPPTRPRSGQRRHREVCVCEASAEPETSL